MKRKNELKLKKTLINDGKYFDSILENYPSISSAIKLKIYSHILYARVLKWTAEITSNFQSLSEKLELLKVCKIFEEAAWNTFQQITDTNCSYGTFQNFKQSFKRLENMKRYLQTSVVVETYYYKVEPNSDTS